MDFNSAKMTFFSSLLEEGFDLRLRVTGRSMSPFLASGDYVTLSRVPLDALRLGDIIFFRSGDGAFKLHRLIALKKDCIIAKGDALRSPDLPVDRRHYIGKVIRIECSDSRSAGMFNLELPASRFAAYLTALFERFKLFVRAFT